jgi:CRP/FNR family transcriptional regulator, cyclic AMP receptor protein
MSILLAIGYFNAALGVAMLAMKTMIPLRITGIAHNIVSIIFGFATGVYPMLVQHAILLPINAWRMREMMHLLRDVRSASGGNLSMDWTKPFTHKHRIKAGSVLFGKGESANAMYFIVSGKLKLRELGFLIMPGGVVGELGFLSPDRVRTQTVECIEDAVLLTITYDKLEELYFQSPKFGFYFLKLSTARLFDNVSRLEAGIAQRDAEIVRLRLLAGLPAR